MSRIFISHASADKDPAHRVAAALTAAGHDVWLADTALRPGDQIVTTIARAIEISDVVLLLVSKASQSSAAVDTEAALAAGKILSGRGGAIIPVVLDRGVELPFALRGFQAVHADPSNFDPAALIAIVADAQEGQQPLREILRLQRDAVEFERNSLENARAAEVIHRMERWRFLLIRLAVLAATVVPVALSILVTLALHNELLEPVIIAVAGAVAASFATMRFLTQSMTIRSEELRLLRHHLDILERQRQARDSRPGAQ